MNVSFNGRDSPMFPSLVDFYTFYHLFSGLFAYIILHKYLKFSLLNSFIIYNLLHLIYECKDFYYTYLKKYYGPRQVYSERVRDLGYHSNNSYINSISDLVFGIVGFLIIPTLKKIT
jgi:hypothetical protein